jgi:predicted helicase
MIKKYLKNIAKTTAHGDQREESYYPAVKNLLIEFANSINKKKVSVTILPKKTEAGNPDFRVWDGDNKVVGYIEAKVPCTDLNRTEISKQLKRYLETFPNVILTDFYEFRLYRNGDMIEKVSIGSSFIPKKLKTQPLVENQADFERLLEKFLDFSLPKIFTAESLAIELAKRTRFLRDEIISVELQNTSNKNYIRGFYNAFQKYLIAGLQETEFADLYSQTVTYGMFAAKTRAKQNEIFNRKNAVDNIPPTVGLLRDIFEFISLGKLPPQMEVIIDDIAEVLSVADATKLLNDFYKQGKGDDPIIHFYETFLNKYDPATREKRGVYYTPKPVVKYIVNSVDEILIQYFNKTGFADTTVKVLDPAGGTLTFLAEATKKALQTFVEHFGDGDKSGFIKKHILKNFYGFELMMSPYAIAHLKMSYLLQEQGYVLQNSDRFQLYLTNTLDAKVVDMPELPGLSSLAEEAAEANKIRKDTPVLAIIGNPPYSKASYNKSEFETDLMKLYKEDVKDEKNIQILSDDYIKFIRYCHWKIEKSKNGIIGLITKNTYLNIAAAKGLRKQLLLTFDKIYILNLHGKLYEKTPDGDKDQNVFDIRVGIAILFLVKIKTKKKKSYAKLYYKDLYGNRDFKYDFLIKNNLFSTFTKKDEIKIDKNYYFFERKIYSNADLYYSFWAVNDIFLQKNSGVKTHRDHFIISENKKELANRLKNFIRLSPELIIETYNLANSSTFNISKIKSSFKKIDEKKFSVYLHKPFNKKYIYYDNRFIDRDRKSLMRYFINKSNLGIIISRRHNQKKNNTVFISDTVTDINVFGFQSYIFPLWIYKQNGDAFSGNGKQKNQVSNINPKIEELIQKTYSKQNITEEIFYYIYAVLHSNTYRTSFSELLKIDYPKIPLTKNRGVFEKISELGKELVGLHLLKSPKIAKPQIRFQGNGNGQFEKPKYDKKQKIITINETQYFDNISQKLWDFEIGKNRVIQQWIKRKEKIKFEDAGEFSRIATAIYETFNLQNEIDKIYPEILNELIGYSDSTNTMLN